MTLDFESIKGACIISQYDFIKKMHSNFPKELKGLYRDTPAPLDLFKINNDAPIVSLEHKEVYHVYSAKSLWLGQRDRLDMQLATGFHCTRVKCANVDDFSKLK